MKITLFKIKACVGFVISTYIIFSSLPSMREVVQDDLIVNTPTTSKETKKLMYNIRGAMNYLLEYTSIYFCI